MIDFPTHQDVGPKIGANLVACREQLGWNQQELAHRVGVNPSTISRQERGEFIPPTLSVIRYAQVLGVNPSEIIDV